MANELAACQILVVTSLRAVDRRGLGASFVAALGLAAAVLHLPQSSLLAQEEEARVVAARIQRFYAATSGFRMSFQQDYWSAAYRRTTTSRGRLAVLAPRRFRFDYATPPGRIVVSDGDVLTYYEPTDPGAPGQYWSTDADSLSDAIGLLTGAARIEAGYTVALGDPGSALEGCTVLTLRPRMPDASIAVLRLHVSDLPGAEGVVRRISIGDHEGNWNTFTFTDFAFAAVVPASEFAFVPPADARRVVPPTP